MYEYVVVEPLGSLGDIDWHDIGAFTTHDMANRFAEWITETTGHAACVLRVEGFDYIDPGEAQHPERVA